MEMSLLTQQQAADLMEVHVAWVDMFIELGSLERHEGPNGETLIDADEILDKHFEAPHFQTTSLAHVRSMLMAMSCTCRHPK
jgi:hypothetical protein